MMSFSGFVRFCALLRLPVWRLLAPVVGKNRSEKKVRKVMKTCHAGESDPGAVGPLREQTSDHQTPKQWDRTRPGAPSGTVADISYIFYIFIYFLLFSYYFLLIP